MKKILFYNDFHYGDIHMSRNYIKDLMEIFGNDNEYYSYHINHPDILKDIPNLKHTTNKSGFDIYVNTWIAHNTSTIPFNGCNFTYYHECMKILYNSLGILDKLKDVDYYIPNIDYNQYYIKNCIDFINRNKKFILICNNDVKSGQADNFDMSNLINIVSYLLNDYDIVITNYNQNIIKKDNIFYCNEIIKNEVGLDLNEISFLSIFSSMIIGRSSGPYSFSVVKENYNRKVPFICLTNKEYDCWYCKNNTNVIWSNDYNIDNIINLIKINLIMETEKKFYGQFGTDKIIKEYFQKNYIGNCIEIGAVDGKFISNTLHFEECGWSTLCIEPIPEYFNELIKNRKNCINYAITNQNIDNIPFTMVTMNNGGKSSISGLEIDERLIESHNNMGLNPSKSVILVNGRRLDWCIETYFNHENIDFVSIDTEGNELDVLKSFDVNKYNIKLLVVENNYNEPEIELYLNEKGWIKDKRIEVNDFYIKKI